MPSYRSVVAGTGLFLLLTAVSQCTSPRPESGTTTAATLLGKLKPVVSVKELMKSEIDPLADNIFYSVSSEVTANGIVDKAPQTDEEWAKVQTGAVVLAEAANLLKIPRPFAPPGDLNNSDGPNAPELSPDAIKAKVDGDMALWNAHVEHLREVAVEVLDIVKRKEAAALIQAGGKLDEACEQCHLEYWYPGDKKFHEERERRFLEEQKNGESRRSPSGK